MNSGDHHEPLASGSDDVDRVDFRRQLAYLQMDETDRQRLKAVAPVLSACSSEFVETFYRHLFRFEETAKFLQDPPLVERLKQAQRDHLESMLEAQWDENYVDRRRRVGDVHAQVGINPRMFLGAYNQYLQFCFRRLAQDGDPRIREFVELSLSLLKAVLFDVGLTLDAYFLHATENLQQALDMVYQANNELQQFAN